MAVHVTCQFDLPLPPAQVWNALKNVAEVAGCFPGVTKIEPMDDRSCKGVVLVKLGPMQLEFAGQFAFTELDDVALKASAQAQGQDQRGRGRAESKISLQVAPTPGGCRTTVLAETELSGTVAQFGRAKSVIQAVAETLIGDFAKNLERKLAPEPVAAVPVAVAPPTLAGDIAPAPATAAAPVAPVAARPNSPTPVSGFGLALRVIAQWWRGLLGRA
jgi:carbon monoxide dehydrogenase subunit G